MAQNHFRAGIHKAKTQTFPGADAGSDHNLVTLNCRVRLKKKKKQHMNCRLKFNLDKLKDPSFHESFQITVCRKFAELLMFAEALTNKFNAVMTETANEILMKITTAKLNHGSPKKTSKEDV